MTLGRAAAWLVGCALMLGACKDGRKPTAPPEPDVRVEDLRATSELVIEADEIVEAFATGLVAALHARMTPELAGRVRMSDLEFAAQHLRERFGPPIGLMEEKVHKEGALLWYSGLIVHALPADPTAKEGSPEQRGVLAPVLYQFAITSDRKLARLLVREHWFWSAVQHPAEYYVPVNRFLVPGRGEWYVSHGGRTRATNKHHGSKSQRYAFDLVVRRDGRARPRNSSKRNESYYCHGEPLLAPASGVVILKKDGIPENKVGELGPGGGNGVRIDHGFGEISSLWHAIPGSIRVEEGDHVEAGQQVGRVGNSGRSSGPHIHMDVYYERREFGLPVEFVDSYVGGRWRDRVMPVRGEQVRSWPADGKSARTARAPVVLVAG